MSVKTRRNLFELIAGLDISEEEKKEYLEYIFQRNPVIDGLYVYKQNAPCYRGEGSIISVKEEPIKLKSFFEGNEGVTMIHRELSCFTKYILPNLPEEYTPRKELRAFKFNLGSNNILIPDVRFDGSVEGLLQTEGFTVCEILAVFVAGIKQAEEYFLKNQKPVFETNPSGYVSYFPRPSKPFLDITGQSTTCTPWDREEEKFLSEFTISYSIEKNAWEVLFWDGGGD